MLHRMPHMYRSIISYLSLNCFISLAQLFHIHSTSLEQCYIPCHIPSAPWPLQHCRRMRCSSASSGLSTCASAAGASGAHGRRLRSVRSLPLSTSGFSMFAGIRLQCHLRLPASSCIFLHPLASHLVRGAPPAVPSSPPCSSPQLIRFECALSAWSSPQCTANTLEEL